jgi:hypothetical protein
MLESRRFEKVGDEKYQALSLKYRRAGEARYFRDFLSLIQRVERVGGAKIFGRVANLEVG